MKIIHREFVFGIVSIVHVNDESWLIDLESFGPIVRQVKEISWIFNPFILGISDHFLFLCRCVTSHSSNVWSNRGQSAIDSLAAIW